MFDLCFVLHCLVTFLALASGPLPSLFKIRSCSQKWPCPGDHLGYIGKNMKAFFLKQTA